MKHVRNHPQIRVSTTKNVKSHSYNQNVKISSLAHTTCVQGIKLKSLQVMLFFNHRARRSLKTINTMITLFFIVCDWTSLCLVIKTLPFLCHRWIFLVFAVFSWKGNIFESLVSSYKRPLSWNLKMTKQLCFIHCHKKNRNKLLEEGPKNGRHLIQRSKLHWMR